MKKYLLILLCLALGILMVSSMVTAGTTPGSGIASTAHDLSAGRPGASFGDTAEQGALDRICIYCHAPHHTIKLGSAEANGVDYLPLWNHGVTVQTYLMYNNGPNDPTTGQHKSKAEEIQTQPGAVSRLCLSCHDGSVATNAYGVTANASAKGAGDKFIGATSQYLIGGLDATSGMYDLQNHHPIGFDYDTVQAADDEIALKTATFTGSEGPVAIQDVLWGNKMECSTCHDVHNTKNAGDKYVYTKDTKSAFCLVCHLK